MGLLRTSVVSFIAAGLLLANSVSVAFAQIDRASLSGTVVDHAGNLLPGVQVEVYASATGLYRRAMTSQTGTFEVAALPVGDYTVRFVAAGFSTLTYEHVTQSVGSTRTLDAMMEVAGPQDVVDISAEAPLLDKTTDTLGARTESRQIRDLPLNGRNWSTLTALAPGAIDTGGSNQRSVRFAGRGLDDNNFTYDGIDATNIINQAQQPFVRLAIPTDTIQEFHIDTMLFTAESGATPGGQVDVASKSGSNALHGGLFEFARNAIFDAREPILPERLPFSLNQFGGNVGGKLVRDRTFYFLAYEGLRQTYGQPLLGYVPSPAFSAKVVATSPVLGAVVRAYPTTGLSPIDGNPDEAEFKGSGHQLDNEDSAMLRIDDRFSPSDTAYLRFSFDAARSNVPLASGGAYLNNRQLITSRPVNGELEGLHVFSNNLVNEAKFGFNRSTAFTTNQSLAGIPFAINVSGLTPLANNEFKVGVGNSFSYIDNLTAVHGSHTLKFGTEVRRIQLDQGNTANGTVSYASLSAFLNNQVSSATFAQALPENGLRKTELYSYAQDEWKVRPNLTLNLGVRYTFFNVFHEVHGKAIPFDFGTCGPVGFCGAGKSFGNLNTLDVDPRVSFAWTPRPGGKTVIRSGFGIYHGDGQLDDQNLPISNEVGQYSFSSKSTVGLAFPITTFLNGPGIVSARDDDRNRKDMYVSQWGLSIQRALPYELVGTLSYVGSKGTYLLSTSYTNLINPVTGVRPYPAFGQVTWRGNTNNSSYNGLVAGVQRTLNRGLLLSFNYTYSHEIDQDAAGGGDSDNPQNPACMSCERAAGDYDARHVVNGNVIYDLPFGPGQMFLSRPGFLSTLFGGWSLSEIIVARTGLPVNVTEDRSSSSVATGYSINQRPDRAIGVPLTPPGGKRIEQWINPAAFTAVTGSGYGDLPRNIARGPNLWQEDVGLAKRVLLSERAQLQFRGEVFNLFNRAQYGLPQADWSSSSFGQIITTVNSSPIGTGTPRELQLALRLEF